VIVCLSVCQVSYLIIFSDEWRKVNKLQQLPSLRTLSTEQWYEIGERKRLIAGAKIKQEAKLSLG